MTVYSKELNVVLTKLSVEKLLASTKYPQKYQRQGNLMTLDFATPYINQNTIERWTKACILPVPEKGFLAIIKNYRGITLTSIARKVYKALLLNRIELEIEKIL